MKQKINKDLFEFVENSVAHVYNIRIKKGRFSFENLKAFRKLKVSSKFK